MSCRRGEAAGIRRLPSKTRIREVQKLGCASKVLGFGQRSITGDRSRSHLLGVSCKSRGSGVMLKVWVETKHEIHYWGRGLRGRGAPNSPNMNARLVWTTLRVSPAPQC